MDIASISNSLVALALLAPGFSGAEEAPTDSHEVPAFVLKRVELAIGNNDPAQPAAPNAAQPTPAADIATTGAIR